MQAQKNHLRTKIDGYEMVHRATHMAKSLYNLALYAIREHYQETNHVLTLKELFHRLKDHPYYLNLSSDHAQLTFRKVIQAYQSYFALLKLKKKGEYEEMVRPPRFLPKNGHFQLEFIQRQIKREGKFLRISFGRRGMQSLDRQYLHVRIPDNLLGLPIHGVRIISKFNNYFEIEFLYMPEEKIPDLDFSQHLGIDLGLDNLVTAVSTKETAFILKDVASNHTNHDGTSKLQGLNPNMTGRASEQERN